ncbi:hypothetical protein BX24_24855, partial [Escherichia coli O91:H21 str. 2009C-4646]
LDVTGQGEPFQFMGSPRDYFRPSGNGDSAPCGKSGAKRGGIIDSIRSAPVIAFRCRSHRRHNTALLPCQRVRGKPESTGMVSQWRQGRSGQRCGGNRR